MKKIEDVLGEDSTRQEQIDEKLITDSLQILVNAVQIAQSKGAFNLEESAIIYNALKNIQSMK